MCDIIEHKLGTGHAGLQVFYYGMRVYDTETNRRYPRALFLCFVLAEVRGQGIVFWGEGI